jgi:hypothetical protein
MAVLYTVTGLGVTVVYHRMLTHLDEGRRRRQVPGRVDPASDRT